jgi:hypothetical protein
LYTNGSPNAGGQGVYSYSNWNQAIADGLVAGNFTSSNPWSLTPQQPFSITASQPITGIFDPARYGGEVDPKLRAVVTIWEWEPLNTYTLDGYVIADTAGAVVTITLTEAHLYGSSPSPHSVTTMATAVAAGEKIPIRLTLQTPETDGTLQFSVSGSISKGQMTYSFEPEVQTLR